MSATTPTTFFKPDRRANRLDDWRWEQVGGKWLVLLRGSDDTAKHVVACISGARLVDRNSEHRPYWTHRVHLADHPTRALEDLLNLLRRILVLCVRDEVDGAVAIDFYSQPSITSPDKLEYTETGARIHLIKEYGRSRTAQINAAGRALCRSMQSAVEGHPWLRSATHLLPVPGHDWRAPASASVRIGHTLHRALGMQLVAVGGRSEFRQSTKGMSPEARAVLLDEFVVTEDLSGRTVLIVDDVYHTGFTMAGVAKAARQAGAVTVLGLVAARNLRRG